MTDSRVQAGVERLVQFYEQLSPELLDQLHTCYTPQAHFKDPFNDVRGIDAVLTVFAHMFVTLESPRFIVKTRLIQGQQAFLAWEFHFQLRRWRVGQALCVSGGTLIQLDENGLVTDHRDYWDTAEEFYAKLPVLGGLMRYLRRSASATAGTHHAEPSGGK